MTTYRIQRSPNTYRNSSDSNQNLVNYLRESGILRTPRIIEAFVQIPRSEFVEDNLKNEAYSDNPIRFEKLNFNMSAPHIYALTLVRFQKTYLF